MHVNPFCRTSLVQTASQCNTGQFAVDPSGRTRQVHQNKDSILLWQCSTFLLKRALKIQLAHHCNAGQFANALPRLLTLLAGQIWSVKNWILLWQCSTFPFKVYSKLCEGSVILTVTTKIEFRSKYFLLIIFCSPVFYNKKWNSLMIFVVIGIDNFLQETFIVGTFW